MSWEAVSAVASVVTAAVIAITAIVAGVQIRHLRASNQITAALALGREFNDLRDARTFVMRDLEELLKDKTFREELVSGRCDRAKHLELGIGNFWDRCGNMLRAGLLDRHIFFKSSATACVDSWRAMREVTRAIRQRNPGVWENFEYLARLSAIFISDEARHPMTLPDWPPGSEDLDLGQ